MLVPTVIYENSLVKVAVSTMNFENDQEFQVKLERLSSDGKTIELQKAKSIQKSTTRLLELETKSLENKSYQRYQLTASGPEGENHKIKVSVSKRPVMILIQTDKPVYKPGDTIKFRVLVLDHETRPLKNLKSVKVQLKDNSGILIKEWPFASLENGVFQSQIDLANFIPLGEWTLNVLALHSEKVQKSITIAEYVLPMHEIRIKQTKRYTFKDSTVELLIEANYKFGKPIKGILFVKLGEMDYPFKPETNGRSVISFALEDVVNLDYEEDIYWLAVSVKIEESGSGHIYEASDTIPIYKQSHKIEIRKASKYLLPEEPFRYWLKLTDPHGTPLPNPGAMNITVIDHVRFWFSEPYTLSQIPDINGEVSLIHNASNSIKKLEIQVEYDGRMEKFEVVQEADVDENYRSFFQASVLCDQGNLNQSVEAMVQSSFQMNLVLYHVITQGEIQAFGRVNVANKRSVNFSFKTNFAMVPEASLAVFAIHEGKLWKDVVRFKVHGLNNKVDVQLSTNITEPGTKIGVTVTSQPGSQVGLLAIDRGMLQLGSGNDITRQLVLETLGAPRKQEGDDLTTLGFKVLTNVKEDENVIQMDLRFGEDAVDYPLITSHSSLYNKILRKKFPGTWLWTEMAPVDSKGRLEIEEIVPDSITSWSISAFAIKMDSGLGVINHPVALNVLKSFFITVNYAYSIVKTEIAIVEVLVHNYLDQNQETEVQIWNDRGEFQFIDEKNRTKSNLKDSHQISTPSNSVSKVMFMLKPTTSGNLLIIIEAECDVAKDAVQHHLRVTPGGLLYVQNEARYIEVEQSSMNFTNLRLVIPKKVTTGSENITFSAEGILLGAAVANLDKLIRLPSGCGEQNMLNLVPSVIALEYMSNTATLSKETKAKALEYLQKGYQNQLNYRLRDGSFSVFGQSDGRGSVFLTALTARTLRFAEKYINVDKDVIDRAFDWLKERQESNGRFTESGKVFHRNLQSGLKDGSSLTAYILIAFLEHKSLAVKYKSVIEKGVIYISHQEMSLTSAYDLALVSYALHLANHSRKDYFLDKLLELSETDGVFRWWGDAPTNIETTAYALLTYMSRGMYVDAKSIMKWLVSQRYDKGGYDNTQNTYVGLQALGQYSQKMSISRNDYQITIDYEGGQQQQYMDRESSLKGVQLTLPSNVRSVDVTAEGTGVGVFQIAYQYNVVAKDTEPRFTINTTAQHNFPWVTLNICTKFQPKRPFEVTNMVIIEVQLPSGCITHDRDVIAAEVRRTETLDDNTHVILYLDPLPANKLVCGSLKAFQKAFVLNQAPGWIKVYDYYDPTREELEYFSFLDSQ